MPEIRSMSAQNTYLAREATPGVAETTGFFSVPGIRLRPGWDGDRETFRGGGGKVVTTTLGTDEVSPWETEVAACFNHLGIPLASRYGRPTTTTPGGGTNSRHHDFAISPIAEDAFRAYTAIWGDGFVGLRGVYGYFNDLSVDISRGEVSVDSSFRSRAVGTGVIAPISEVQTITITGSPTGGTFTITLPFAIGGSGTTAGIAYNASAATVKSAIVAIAGGKFTTDDLDVTGGPGPGTPWVVTFKGRYAQQNLAIMTCASSLTGGSSPTVGASETTAGGVPTSMALAPMPSNMWDVYIDSTWAALGTTQYGGAYNAKLEFGEKYDEDMPINSSIVSYEQPIEKAEQDDTFELTLRLGATALAQFNNLQVGTKQFFRLKLSSANGPNPYYIESTIPYLCQFDFCAEIVSRGTIDTAPNSSAVVVPLSLVLTKDPTTGNYAACRLTNTVTQY